MSKTPPLLPAELMRRTLRTAHFDGLSILVLSGLFALVSASAQDKLGTVVGLMVAGAGAIELHGAGLVRHGEFKGMKWLVLSQLYLLATILGFVRYKLGHVDLGFLRQAFSYMSTDQKQQLLQPGFTEDESLGAMYSALYYLIALLTIPYQGGMALYYLRRRRAVAAALAQGR
jgi:hypothetical protein